MPVSISDQANLIAPEPFPMFTNDGNGIQLTSTAECVLSQLQKGYKLKVISVAGGYRSSKNYLMNHWIRARKGHSMANVVQAEAEGIWAWGRILHDEKSYLLVLDTEGLGDCVRAKDPEKDMRFYTLAMLLSSYFVLNVTRVGEDENTIALLRYATQLSETLVRRATEHPEADGMRTAKLDAALQRYLPDLMILIRDAALMSILEIPGMNATPEDYLSSCLKDKGNDGNTTKLAIDTHFPSLWCEAIRAPSERNDVEQLGNMPDNELDPKFIAKMTQIADQILHIVQPKRYFGDLSGTDGMETRVLDGPCYLTFCKEIARMLNEKKPVVLGDLFEKVLEHESVVATNMARQIYTSSMDEAVTKFPMNKINLLKCHVAALDAASKVILDTLVSTAREDTLALFRFEAEVQTEKGLLATDEGLYSQYWVKNEQASSKECQKLFDTLVAPIEEKNSQGKAQTLDEFMAAIKAVYYDYFSHAVGPAKYSVWARNKPRLDIQKSTAFDALNANDLERRLAKAQLDALKDHEHAQEEKDVSTTRAEQSQILSASLSAMSERVNERIHEDKGRHEQEKGAMTAKLDADLQKARAHKDAELTNALSSRKHVIKDMDITAATPCEMYDAKRHGPKVRGDREIFTGPRGVRYYFSGNGYRIYIPTATAPVATSRRASR